MSLVSVLRGVNGADFRERESESAADAPLFCMSPRRLWVLLVGKARRMAWFPYRFPYVRSVCDWLWFKLVLLWSFADHRLRSILRYVYSAIGWRKEPGRGRAESGWDYSDDETFDQVNFEASGEGGQREAVVGQRAVGYHGGPPVRELPGRADSKESCAEPGTSGGAESGPSGFKLKCEEDHEEEEGWSGYEDEDDDEFDDPRYRVQTTDELYCGYDSTWETEESQESSVNRRPAKTRNYKFGRFQNAAMDMQNYRHDYPGNIPVFTDMPNLRFYLGQMRSLPDGFYIQDFHKDWFGDYYSLEYVHSYIQWLFPLQEPGMNYEAVPMTKDEVKDFLQSDIAKRNLLTSYKLMLDFYGIQLCDEKTGQVQRASNWKERFHNLNTHTHNNLRITRILKCQGTLGYQHYQAPLVHFFLEQTLVHRQLPNVKDSVLNYFVFAVRNKSQRRKLLKYAYLNYDQKDEFVWCPKKIQMLWSPKASDEENF